MYSEVLGLQKYRVTFFLFNVRTEEIVVLVQFEYDSDNPGDLGAYQIGVQDSLMIFHVNASDDVGVVPVEGTYAKKAIMYAGQRLVIDLEHQKGYLVAQTDELCTRDEIIEGKLLHYAWNADHTAVSATFRDLATGEETPVPDLFEGYTWYNLRDYGSYYVLSLYDPDNTSTTVRIRKEDFWAGNPVFIPFPDWASVW